jgi:hypothetical protein
VRVIKTDLAFNVRLVTQLLVLASFDTRVMPQVNFFYIKNILKNKNLKILGFFVKLCPKILGLAATPDLRVIFIILIIKLNLHDPSLSESGCNTGPKNTECGSGYKVVS